MDMATSKTKPVRNYRDRFVKYTQARERNRKAACKQAGEKLKAAVTSGGSSLTHGGSEAAIS